LAEQIVEAAAKLRGTRPAPVSFITESSEGEFSSERPLWGVQQAGKIFLVRGLTVRQMVKTLAHEVDHVADYHKGNYSATVEHRAKIFEREFSELFRNENLIELSRALARFIDPTE